MHLSPLVLQQIALKVNAPATSLTKQMVSGGCINNNFKLSVTGSKQNFFCKLNSATNFPHLFNKEAAGLRAIEQTGTCKTPEVISFFEAEDQQALLLEWVNPGVTTKLFWERFGHQLASMHRVSHRCFGWKEDNYMGSVVQKNTETENWNVFFAQQRLHPLVESCYQQKLFTQQHIQQFEKVYDRLNHVFDAEPPALVHGDLWSGNFICNEHQEPVLIDPAIYFGHRSVDLAMTTLFGGFDQRFYDAYQEHFPFPKNYRAQWQLCNLYPLLIHLIVFGTGYLSSVEQTLRAFQ